MIGMSGSMMGGARVDYVDSCRVPVPDEKKCAVIDAYWDRNWQADLIGEMKPRKSWRGTPDWYTWEGPRFVPHERMQPVLPTALPTPWDAKTEESTDRSTPTLSPLDCDQSESKSSIESLDYLFEELAQEPEGLDSRKAWSANSPEIGDEKASNASEESQETNCAENRLTNRKFAKLKVRRYEAVSQNSIGMTRKDASSAEERTASCGSGDGQAMSIFGSGASGK